MCKHALDVQPGSAKTPGMRRGTLILAASILANAALGYGIYRARQPVGLAPETITASTPEAPRKKAVFGSKTPAISTPVAAVETTNAPAFRWAMLESEDFKEYVARLRAFGVPEKTVRDIIMAEINALYRPKFAALRPPPINQTNYWQRSPYWGGNRQTPEQRAQQKALYKEQRELVQSIFGEDVYKLMAKEEGGYVDPLEKIIGSENQALLEQVNSIRERLQEQEQDIYAKSKGYIDQWTQEDLKKIRAAGRDELAKLLTPEQLEQYELRNSDTAQQLRYSLGPFEPTEDEFKALFRFKQAQEKAGVQVGATDDDGNYLQPDREYLAARNKLAKDSEEALKTALGDDRIKEFKLYEDYGTRQLAEAGVPKENLFKLSDVKTEAEKAAQKIRTDRSLSAEQRKAALVAIHEETMKELGSLLGDRNARAYRGNGGYWLRNINPPQ